MSPEHQRHHNEEHLTQLLDTWHRHTSAHSSMHAIMAHPNVALIREYGTEALLVLLRRLENDPDGPDAPGWGEISLLFEMAGDEVVLPEEHRGVYEEQIKVLLEWGKSRGHI